MQVGVKQSRTYDTVPKVVVEKWYTQLPAAKQQSVLLAAPRVAQTDARLARELRVDGLGLRSPKPIRAQGSLARRFAGIRFLALPDRVLERLDDVVIPVRPGGGGGPTIIPNKGLRFRTSRVKCIDETDPELFGKDTIAMGGTAVDDAEAVTIINEFRVGDFDDGDQVSYSPLKVLKAFNLSGSAHPKTFGVFLALAEKDAGGFGGFLTDLYEAIKGEVVVILMALGAAAGAAIGAAIGGTLGTVVGGPVGTVIGVAAGLVLGALIGWLAELAKDDFFEPQVALIELPTANATFDAGAPVSPTFNFTYADFGGQYRVSYSRELSR